MKTIDPINPHYPNGPSEPVDLNADQKSFAKIGELFADYGDICMLQSSTRNKKSYLVNNPDFLKHILVRNNDILADTDHS